MSESLAERLAMAEGGKIVLLVLDGLGDIPHPDFGENTPLSAAKTPNLDKLAPVSALGRLTPVAPGVIPGSGPGHLGLFGYDPLEHEIGRGVLEALGLDMVLAGGDLAARANFATRDRRGIITDRRAGRIPTETNVKLVEKLRSVVKIPGYTVELKSGVGHRFAAIFRGPHLADGLTDADPHHEGELLLEIKPTRPEAAAAASVCNEFLRQANAAIASERPANTVMLRGLSCAPSIKPFGERFKVRAAAIATYPMYRGIAKLLGMDLEPTGDTIEHNFRTFTEVYDRYDYFFIHVKPTDAAGEDGNFPAKVACIEVVDAALPILLEKKPTALAITGDHSTPILCKGHSWHPIPVLVHSEISGRDGCPRFTEAHCLTGSLGLMDSKHLMTVLLANAKRLDKFGA
jgi:2,3-bisphosphoglycerate-independent phosphoglycerate mutase